MVNGKGFDGEGGVVEIGGGPVDLVGLDTVVPGAVSVSPGAPDGTAREPLPPRVIAWPQAVPTPTSSSTMSRARERIVRVSAALERWLRPRHESGIPEASAPIGS
jgi:hypothetical protein